MGPAEVEAEIDRLHGVVMQGGPDGPLCGSCAAQAELSAIHLRAINRIAVALERMSGGLPTKISSIVGALS